MNQYRILYTWQDRHYSTVMQHFAAASAIQAAQVTIVKGAQVYGVELAGNASA